MFEVFTSAILVLACVAMGLIFIGYAARQWRKLKRGN